MALQRTQNNIVNIGFQIMNKEVTVKDGQGRTKKVRPQGVEVTHATVNGNSAGVGLRTINGGQKSAQINLDTQALTDLREALTEILETGSDK